MKKLYQNGKIGFKKNLNKKDPELSIDFPVFNGEIFCKTYCTTMVQTHTIRSKTFKRIKYEWKIVIIFKTLCKMLTVMNK